MSLACLLFVASVTSMAWVPAQECPPHPVSPSQIEAPIRDITFSNDSLLPQEDEDQIVRLARGMMIDRNALAHGMSMVADETAERTRVSFQNEGYFKAEISSEAVEKTEDPGQYNILVSVRKTGPQYRVDEIRFANATYFPTQQLRDLFLIQRGEIFSRSKIAKGLDALRRLYGSQGYINYTGVPETDFEDETRIANLTVNVDEGKQFRLRHVDVVGLDPETKARVLDEFALKAGDVYTSEAWERVSRKFPDLVQNPNPDALDKRLDEENALVDVVLDFRPHSICTGEPYSGPEMLESSTNF